MSSSDSASSAVVRALSESIAADLAHAPLRTRSHASLLSVTSSFVAMERYMGATADMLTHAISRSRELTSEAAKWRRIAEGGGSLREMLDASARRVAGRRLSSMDYEMPVAVSDEVAHP